MSTKRCNGGDSLSFPFPPTPADEEKERNDQREICDLLKRGLVNVSLVVRPHHPPFLPSRRAFSSVGGTYESNQPLTQLLS
jgi:hypothetical protein